MAVAPFRAHPAGLNAQVRGDANYLGAPVAAVLVTTAHTPDVQADASYQHIAANECQDAGYAPVNLTAKTIAVSGPSVRFGCGKITLTSSGSIAGRYLYFLLGNAGALANSTLILGHVDLTQGGNLSSANGEFSFTPHASGLFDINGSGTGVGEAVAINYDNAASGLAANNVQAAIDEVAAGLAGVPTLIRRRYVIRNGVNGIVSGTVDNTQAEVNRAAVQAIIDAADANGGGVEMDQEEIQIATGPIIVRNTAGGLIWDSPTYARFTQRTNNVGILQIGDATDICQNLDFSGVNLHYLNSQAANTGGIACRVYNQWKSRIGKIQVANTITAAQPYIGIQLTQSQSVFSCDFHNLFSFRAAQYALHIQNFGTGNSWLNTYLSAVGTNGAASAIAALLYWEIASGQQMHDSSWKQLNGEWAITNTVFRFNNVRGACFNSTHLEQCILSGANATMLHNIISNLQFNSLQLLDMRIQGASASDHPSIHKSFNNGRTNVDTLCWVNNNSSYIDRNFYEHYQQDSDGFTTQPGYFQKRSWSWVDGVGTVLRDNIRPDRTLGGTDKDGAAWGNLDVLSGAEAVYGGAMSHMKGANLRVTTTKTLYGQYMRDCPTLTVPGNPNAGADISITLSNFMGPTSSRWANTPIPDGSIIGIHRGGTTSGVVHILRHDGTEILTLPSGAASATYHVHKINGQWAATT
jgi:hypothetical protein